jgi:predicted nucleotidyltransferase
VSAATLDVVASVANRLASLQVVFVGASVLPLYLRPELRSSARMTDDVDCVTEVLSTMDYSQLGQRLDRMHFSTIDLPADSPICRYRSPDGVLVDIMPVSADVIGFSNPWYREGFDQAESVVLPDGTAIQVLPAWCFLATKLSAFDGRGASDPLASHDLEDIIALLDGGEGINHWLDDATPAARAYIQGWMRSFLRLPDASELVEGHCPRPNPKGRRSKAILDLMVAWAPR